MASRQSNARVRSPENISPVSLSPCTNQGAIMKRGSQSLSEDGAVLMLTKSDAGSVLLSCGHCGATT